MSPSFADEKSPATSFELPEKDDVFRVPGRSDDTIGSDPYGLIDVQGGPEGRTGIKSRSSFSGIRSFMVGSTISAANFPGVKVANRGIGGDTTRGMLLRLKDDVLALKPNRDRSAHGDKRSGRECRSGNTGGKSQTDYRRDQEVRSETADRSLQVFPSSETKKRPAAKIKKVNELYAAAVKGDPQVILIETWPLFANEQGDVKEAEFPDLLHPNKAGYDKWAAALRPILRRSN